jgi:hypothetical protein
VTDRGTIRRAELRLPDGLRLAAVLTMLWGIGAATACGAEGPAVRETAAKEPVTVRLASGRSFTAAIDGRSDTATLWLRFSADRSTILRPVAWSTVVGGAASGRELSIDELRGRAATARAADESTVRPRPLVTHGGPTRPPAPVARPGGVQTWNVPNAGVVSAAYYAREVRVTHIAIDAQMAGWDAAVEADGLLVDVTPIADDGATLPVSGTVEIELIGPALPPLSRGNSFPVLARWTRQLRADDPAAAGGTYRLRLPFQAYHPEYEFNPSRHALVHVRLLAPGHGTFEASADAVTLRGFTPVRERMEQAFGTRFLPTERTLYGKPQVNVGR